MQESDRHPLRQSERNLNLNSGMFRRHIKAKGQALTGGMDCSGALPVRNSRFFSVQGFFLGINFLNSPDGASGRLEGGRADATTGNQLAEKRFAL